MNRRRFLQNCGLAAFLSPAMLHAGETCGLVAPYISRCTAGIPSELIQVSAIQQQSEWCWAACIEMVFRYYGYIVPQSKIVKDTWGSIVNMPGQPNQIRFLSRICGLIQALEVFLSCDTRRFPS